MPTKEQAYPAIVGLLCIAIPFVHFIAPFDFRYDVTTRTPPLTDGDRVKLIGQAAEGILGCNPHLPGMSVAMVKDGKVFHSAGYGYADAAHTKKVDEYSVFGIASLTKSFSAVLAHTLLRQHKLTRNTKLTTIFGGDFRFQNDLLTRQATVGDLLSHRLGIPNYGFIRFQDVFDRKAIVRAMAHLKQTREFRDSFIYSNLNYGLVGRITELLHNKRNRNSNHENNNSNNNKTHNNEKTWEEIVTELIFKPLGMTKTYLINRNIGVANTSSGHMISSEGGAATEISEDLMKHWGQISASGSIMSPAIDMTKWLHALMHRGRTFDNKKAISGFAIKSATTPRVRGGWVQYFPWKPVVPQTALFTTYGAGFRIGLYKGYHALFHTGSTIGFTSVMMLVPDLKIGVYISFNGYDIYKKARVALTLYIMDHLMGESPWLNMSTLCSFPKPWANMEKEYIIKNHWDHGFVKDETIDHNGEGNDNRSENDNVRNKDITSCVKSNKTNSENNGCTNQVKISKSDITPSRENDNANKNDNLKHNEHSARDTETKEDLTRYVGVYGTPIYGNITITFNSTTGSLDYTYGIMVCVLQKTYLPNTFIVRGVGDTWFYGGNVTFNGERNVVSLTMSALYNRDPALTYYKLT